MSGRRYSSGAAVLVILIFSAIAASSAFAEQQGYECSSSAGTKTFSDAHCVTGGGSSFGHVAIGETVEASGTNAKTASGTTAAAPVKLQGKAAGVVTEIQCEGLHLQGQVHPKVSLKWLEFTLGKWNWTVCIVVKPAGKACVVSGGTIESKELLGTTQGQGPNNVKVSPKSGTEIASVKIEKCTVAGLNNTFPVTGSFTMTASGATLTTTHAGITAQGTLQFAGQNAGLESALTVSRTGGNPIVLT